MTLLLKEIRHRPLLGLLAFVPVVLATAKLKPEAHTLLFLLSVLAIVPLAGLLSRATESVAAKTGDAVGGLLNATLGNLTELVIALTALRAGQYMLVKASIAGAIVTNTLVGVVRGGAVADGIPGVRDGTLPVAAEGADAGRGQHPHEPAPLASRRAAPQPRDSRHLPCRSTCRLRNPHPDAEQIQSKNISGRVLSRAMRAISELKDQ